MNVPQQTVAPERTVATPALAEIITDGYGKLAIRALIDSIEYYMDCMRYREVALSENDSNNIFMLTSMLRATLKDCGVDIE
ncbi:hypothetical protein [Bacteroides caecimuris]|jgi:hypothetical protein|uniref:hypothetical protein n=1 Tax=Bacteroides caecimuris TaxID=1796613 RepID=UPI0025B1EF56|nr:hypothetical protein [Bacteroides caecimuris]